MKLSKEGLEFIKKSEGFRNHVYKDSAGVPTIGYGFTYYSNGVKVKMTDKPITKQDAEKLLLQIVKPFEDAVNNAVKVKLTQNQFDALVSFTYNVGSHAFKNSTLLKVINNNPSDPQIEVEFKRWKYAGGKVIKGLKKRRNQEYYLYKNG